MDRNFDFLKAEFSKLACNRSDSDRQRINYLLDCLNALNYKDCTKVNNDMAVLVIHQCCTLILPSDTFLVAKCCHLILNMVGKMSVKIEGKSLCILANWCVQALKSSADVALIDILQALHAVINSHPSSIADVTKELMVKFSEDLESRASLLTPQEVTAWRIRCIHALLLTGSLTPEQVNQCAEIIYSLIKNPNLETYSCVQVIACCIEAVEGLCQGSAKWLSDNVGDVIGIIMAYLHCGLPNWKFKQPERLFPIPLPIIPNISGPKGPINPRKQKTKAIKQGQKSKQEENSENIDHIFNTFGETNWPTSDSDYSDSEGGRIAKLGRAHSKIRLAVLNLLLQLTKLCGYKELFGYYSNLLGSAGLSHSILKDPAIRVKNTSISAMTVLLSKGKVVFAQAQESESSSFTPYSGVLADQLKSLHGCMIDALNQNQPSVINTSLLYCSAVLISYTPYHRIEPGLVTRLLNTAHTFLKHKERNTTVAVLTCLGSLVTLEPVTEEVRHLISSPVLGSDDTTPNDINGRHWLPELCINLIKESNSPVQVIVEAWQVIGPMARSHFDVLSPHLEPILDVLSLSLENTSDVVQLHAAKALEQISPLMAASKDAEELSVTAWSRLLRGPLLALLQSHNALAAVACDCLAAIGENVYDKLPDDLQILCITLLFGCSEHEESSVRASSIRAAAILLMFSSLSQDEQFVYDVSEAVVKLIGDSVVAVRVKAAWSLGKVTDTLLKCDCEFKYSDIYLERLFKATLTAAVDLDSVQVGAVRALGYLIRLMKSHHMSQPLYKSLVEKAAYSLTKSASTGSNMKLRWNACYALSSFFENKNVYKVMTCNDQDHVITGLCHIISKCNNFKVRVNACHALSSITDRRHSCGLYLHEWQTVLDGLDNAYNMPDFREFKHQNTLFSQLCINLCLLTRQLETRDLTQLHDILVYRIDTAKEHIQRFQKNVLPEETDPILIARNHLSTFNKSNLTDVQRASITLLNSIFSIES